MENILLGVMELVVVLCNDSYSVFHGFIWLSWVIPMGTLERNWIIEILLPALNLEFLGIQEGWD